MFLWCMKKLESLEEETELKIDPRMLELHYHVALFWKLALYTVYKVAFSDLATE